MREQNITSCPKLTPSTMKEGNILGSETQPWIKFVLNDWFQFQVKQYFKIITDLGVDTGKKYTEEQKRAMAHCYYPAYWRMMEQRERDLEHEKK